MIIHHSCIYLSLLSQNTIPTHPLVPVGCEKTRTVGIGIVGRRLRPLASPWWLRKSKQFSFITGPGGRESNRLRLPPRCSRNFSIKHVLFLTIGLVTIWMFIQYQVQYFQLSHETKPLSHPVILTSWFIIIRYSQLGQMKWNRHHLKTPGQITMFSIKS